MKNEKDEEETREARENTGEVISTEKTKMAKIMIDFLRYFFGKLEIIPLSFTIKETEPIIPKIIRNNMKNCEKRINTNKPTTRISKNKKNNDVFSFNIFPTSYGERKLLSHTQTSLVSAIVPSKFILVVPK
ncbi:MAG: hypothetical protein QXQ54_03225 [Thermoplasmata archaeon]